MKASSKVKENVTRRSRRFDDSGLDGSKEKPDPVYVSPTGDIATDKKTDGVEK